MGSGVRSRIILTDWAPGEPNDGSSGNCIRLNKNDGNDRSQHWKWADTSCSQSNAYVCEKATETKCFLDPPTTTTTTTESPTMGPFANGNVGDGAEGRVDDGVEGSGDDGGDNTDSVTSSTTSSTISTVSNSYNGSSFLSRRHRFWGRRR